MHRRIIRRAAVPLWIALGAFLLGADGGPAPTRPEFSQAELEALRREVQRASQEDPFEGGPAPDLVVLTSTNVHGETAPCG